MVRLPSSFESFRHLFVTLFRLFSLHGFGIEERANSTPGAKPLILQHISSHQQDGIDHGSHSQREGRNRGSAQQAAAPGGIVKGPKTRNDSKGSKVE